MSKRPWTPAERQTTYDLIQAHKRAMRAGSDLSRPHYFGNPADAAEKDVDNYFLNEAMDNLRFDIVDDGSEQFAAVKLWHNALDNDIQKYGTANPTVKRELIKQSQETDNLYRAWKSAKGNIDYLLFKKREAELFLHNFPEKLEADTRILHQKEQALNQHLDSLMTGHLDFSSLQ